MKQHEKIAKAFLTKYALTNGIEEVENVEVTAFRHDANGRSDMLKDGDEILESDIIYITNHGSQNNLFERFGKDVFLTREEAVKNAETKRDRKLKSIAKQVKKLKEMTF